MARILDIEVVLPVATIGGRIESISVNGVEQPIVDGNVNIAVPTKTSELNNDSNFVKESELAPVAKSGDYNDLENTPYIPSTEGLAREEYVDESISSHNSSEEAHQDIRDSIPTSTSELNNDDNFQSDAQVDTKIASHNSSPESHQDIRGSIPSTEGLASETYVGNAISEHNTSSQSHQDIRTALAVINSKIPEQASESNQLADKDFVNSSVATNTGYFLATLDIIEDLHLTYDATMFQILSALEAYEFAAEKTNNDYCNVINQDSVGNTLFMRFKWNGKEDTFKYEFSLNNSSFTAVQWAAINSNATAENIAQIAQNVLAISALQSDVAGKVSKSGDTMTGNLEMADSKQIIFKMSADSSLPNNAHRLWEDGGILKLQSTLNGGTTWVNQMQFYNAGNARVNFAGLPTSTHNLVLTEDTLIRLKDAISLLENYLPLAGGTMTGDLKFVKQEEISIEFEAGNAVKWRIWKPTTSGSIYFQIKSGNSWVNRMQISSTGEGRFKGPLFNNDQITYPLVNSEEVKSICLPLTGGELSGDLKIGENIIEFYSNGYYHRILSDSGSLRIQRSTNRTSWSGVATLYGASSNIVGFGEMRSQATTLTTDDTLTRRAHIYKQGIVSQTQTWTKASDKSYSYVMSNQVTGNIPIMFIELVEELGAVFNETSGYFELNGLTDISYKEMKKIYTMSSANISSNTWIGMFRESPLRTNIFNYPTGTSFGNCTMSNMFAYSDIEVANIIPLTQLSEWTTDDIDGANAFLQYIGTSDYIYPATTSSGNAFRNSERLKHIRGIIRYADSSTNFVNMFNLCYSLETIWLYGHNHNTDFSWSPKLKLDTIKFIVNRRSTASTASAFTITLHPTTYATCQTDTTQYTYSGQTYTGIISYAAARNITIQSA